MYGTLRRYKIAPGSADRLAREVQESFVPIVSKLPGFREYFWINSGDNVMCSLSIFDNRAGAEESVRKAADWVRERNLGSLLPNPPEITTGEIVAHQAAPAKSAKA